jgi:NADH-quinone oxidoreductase subunit H
MVPLVTLALIKIVAVLLFLMTAAAYLVLLERRMAAWIQDRRGPNRVGLPVSLFIRGWRDPRLFGLGQPIADGVKMILKEEHTPGYADRTLFILAPIVILTAALAVFVVIPLGAQLPPIPALGIDQPIQLVVAPTFDAALIYVFALSSIAVYGIILGGWASNNKYGFLGALRSSAQMISYELPLGLGILGVVLTTGTLRLDQTIAVQADSGVWLVLLQPLGFLVFVVAGFAEAGRLPFDLPECEQELVGGYHTEYAGIKLLMFMVAEFIHMITASFLMVILFLGGWHLWGITGTTTQVGWGMGLLRAAILLAKVFAVILFFMLVRWTWPRFRFDQLMTLAWKVMLPLGIINLLAVAVVVEAREANWFDGLFRGGAGQWWACLTGWVVLAVSWAAVAWAAPLVTDKSPTMVGRVLTPPT